MLKAGVDKKTIMDWVGHHTSTVTDRYTHMIPERMEDYRAKVNRVVVIDESFVRNSESVTPLWRPNGDQDFEQEKIPSKSEDLEGTICSGAGFEPHTQLIRSIIIFFF